MRLRSTCALLAAPAVCLALEPADPPEPPGTPVVREMETTGYCNCTACCGWVRSWHGFGNPVHASGRLKGRPKEVGQTASGGRARLGTVAADTAVLPIGTVVFIRDFGWGRVEDRGAAIRGDRLDIWFGDHAKALRWGRRRVPVKIWLPDAAPGPEAP